MKNLHLVSLILVPLILMNSSCNNRPERKKMPALCYSNGFIKASKEESTQPSYIVGDTVLNGEHFFSITIPDASKDSESLTMVEMYQPLAQILYNAMIRDGDIGVLINLCIGKMGQAFSADLNVTRENEFSLPMVLLWNKESESRVNELLNLISQLQNFKYTINGKSDLRISENYSIEDCFQFPSVVSAK